MPVKIEMPRLSDTMQAGTVVKWNVKEGDKVKSGQALADIETDKATMELPCYDDGVVAAVPVPAGQNVPIGTVILVLAQAGEDPAAVKAQFAAGGAAAPAKAPAAPAKVAAPAAAPVGAPVAVAAAASSHAPAHANGHSHAPSRVFASPLARKIAADSGVDLGALQGSGPSGRIIRRDVEAALAGGAPAAVATPTTYVAPQLSPSGTKLAGKVVTLSNMRRVIATRLVESKTTVPHYQVSVDVDMDSLLKLRGDLNEQLASQGVKLSVNDFLVRACALAMHQHPYVNSRWVPTPGQEAIELLSDVNIGVAISLPEERGGGLVVATLRNADQTGLRQISSQSKSLADKARAKGLAPQEMSDSTFTISNLGMFGVSHFTAIINPPNAAILAVGAAIQKPVVRNGQLAVGHVMTMTMSSDHRIIDGAMAAAYLATVKGLLEKPATLLV
ncbi:MAG: Dihydrolipoyllysine-residue acetyltransferase component of pyruvate dehydrogenase complex [Planctomycetota bacterium]|jgi:pyruvate dehydrogenase E2 component (dihydrolipoamide acetyltransferase)